MIKKFLCGVVLALLGTLPCQAQNPPGFVPGAGNVIATCPVPTALNVTTSSSNTQLNSASTCGQSVILYNDGSQDAFYRLGTNNSVAALVTDYPLPANTFIVLSILLTQTYIAAITASSTTTIRLSQGTFQ